MRQVPASFVSLFPGYSTGSLPQFSVKNWVFQMNIPQIPCLPFPLKSAFWVRCKKFIPVKTLDGCLKDGITVLLVLVGDVVNGASDFLHQQEVFMAHEADWYLQYMVYAAPFLLLVCCHMSSCLEATERSSSIQYNNDANHSIYQERCKFSL